jgi:transposase
MLTQKTLVKIHVLHRHGESLRAIAQKLGVSRNTVRRYLRALSVAPSYPERTQRATKLNSYRDYLLARIDAAKPYWIPATVLLREIQDRGYAGGVSQLKHYINKSNYCAPMAFYSEGFCARASPQGVCP